MSILPTEFKITGYKIASYAKPALDVGGDYYDFIEGRDNKYWLTIGDVSGHGISAGLVMLMLQTANVNSILNNADLNPDDLVAIANKTIYYNTKNRLKQDMYITCCFFKFDLKGNFSYSGAHENILIFRSKTGTVEQIETNGMWLGIVEDVAKYITLDTFYLDANDILFVYTDGITESMNLKKQMYGLDRLIQFLNKNGKKEPEEIKTLLIDEIDNYKHKQMDDYSFMILKRT